MKRTMVAAGILALALTGCGGTEDNRTATGEDADYIQELIEENEVYAERPDSELLGMADDFCYVLEQSQTPSNAMGALYSEMDQHEAAMYAMITADHRCSGEFYSITQYLGY